MLKAFLEVTDILVMETDGKSNHRHAPMAIVYGRLSLHLSKD